MREWIMQVDDVDIVADCKKPSPKSILSMVEASNRADGPSTQPFDVFGVPLQVNVLEGSDMRSGPQLEHDVGVNSSKLQGDLQERRLTCVHKHAPSVGRLTYSCTLCSGTICQCDQCRMWFCYLCRFSTDLDLGFDAVNDSTFGYSSTTESNPGYGSGFEGLAYSPDFDLGNPTGSSLDESSLFSGCYSLQPIDHSYNLPDIFNDNDNNAPRFQGSAWLMGSLSSDLLQNTNIKREDFIGSSSVS
jgi:hypothetical protein